MKWFTDRYMCHETPIYCMGFSDSMMTSSNGNIFRVTGHLCKGQWRWALMFSLIWARMNGWANNSEAGDLRRHRTHYDVTACNACHPKHSLVVSVALTNFISNQIVFHESNKCKNNADGVGNKNIGNNNNGKRHIKQTDTSTNINKLTRIWMTTDVLTPW